MLANKRQQNIQQLLDARGSITTAELTELFGVSIETVRRDLLLLERQGTLQRVHGGAVPVEKMKHMAELSQRLEENKHEKQALCETAA